MQTRRPVGRRKFTPEDQNAKRRAKELRYKARHREALSRYSVEYARKHPEWVLLRQQKRLARKAGAPISDLTAQQWREIKAAYQGKCAYCGWQSERLTMDHVIPLSKGGNHTASNVVPACIHCNCVKSARSKHPFYPARAAQFSLRL